MFVAKLSSDGSTLLFSTYLGGSSADHGNSIAVDASGNSYITGPTYSSDFPMVNAYDSTFNGSSQVFVAKLSSDGSTLLFSTYLGGSRYDEGVSIAIDASGNSYITGYTYSSDFPMVNAYDSTENGDYDVFVAILSSDGSTLLFSTYLGGSDNDEGKSIAVDAWGNSYITGWTYSSDFPVVNAYDSAFDDTDGFVLKIPWSDKDGDGMSDIWENQMSLDDADATDAILDLDGDGLNNLLEFQFGSWPNQIDSDSDTMDDYYEYYNDLNPLLDDSQLDKDNDGLPNWYEAVSDLKANDSSDATGDLDDDGLSNIQEYQLGTSPNNSDSDSDGMPDGWEFENGLDMLKNDAYSDLDSDGIPNKIEYGLNMNPNNPINGIVIWFTFLLVVSWISVVSYRNYRKKKKLNEFMKCQPTAPQYLLDMIINSDIEYDDIIPIYQETIDAAYLLLEHYSKEGSFPSKKELFKIGTNPDVIPSAMKLFNAHPLPIIHKNKSSIPTNDIIILDKRVITTISERKDNSLPSIEEIVLKSDLNILEGKLILHAWKTLSNFNEWTSDLKNAINGSLTEPADKIAANILDLKYQAQIKDIAPLWIAKMTKLPYITSIYLGNYLIEEMKKEVIIGDLSTEENLHFQEHSQKLLILDENEELINSQEVAEVINKLKIKSLKEALITVQYYVTIILGKDYELSPISLDSTVQIDDIQLEMTVSIGDEIDALIKEFEKMEESQYGKIYKKKLMRF